MAVAPKNVPGLQTIVSRLTKLHFLYILAFAATIVVFHAGNLVTPDVILRRWIFVAIMLTVTTIVWGVGRSSTLSSNTTRILVYALVITDILFASALVYLERGMGALGVSLYAVPIATSAILASRTSLFVTAALSAIAYGLVCIKYFIDFFNEGYKLQLYATLGFYGTVFFVVAGILVIVLSQNRGRR